MSQTITADEYEDLFEHCGCCDHYHRPEFHGDCRKDSERFSMTDLEEQFSRRLEIDRWLEGEGAIVIHVPDLAAVLHAEPPFFFTRHAADLLTRQALGLRKGE